MNLEDFIRTNAGEFDPGEPEMGHFDRFERKLGQTIRINTFKKYKQVAAAVAIIAVFAATTVLLTYPGRFSDGTAAIISTELKETEQYYQWLVNTKYNELIQIEKKYNANIQSRYSAELEEMDKSYSDLKKDLLNNPHNERVINAMIIHYQTRIEVMEKIMDITEEFRI